MIQVELPNAADTDDPIVKKLIKAVQELADQSNSFDTAIFHEMNTGIKGLDKRLTSLESTVNQVSGSQVQVSGSGLRCCVIE